MKFLLKITYKTKIAWTLLLMLLLATITASYQALAPVTDSLGERLRAYNEFSSGFIIMVGIKRGNLQVNEFDIERCFKEHLEWLGPPEKREEMLAYWKKQFEEELPEIYPFTEDDYKVVQEMPNVEAVYHLLNMKARYPIPNKTNTYYAFELLGIEPETADVAMLPFGDIENGRFIYPDEDALVVNFRINQNLGLDVGDDLPLQISLDIRLFPVVGVFSNLLPIYLDFGYTVIANIDTIWRVLHVPLERRRFNGMLVKVVDPSKGLDVVDALRDKYPGTSVFWQQVRARTSVRVMESLARAYGVMRLQFLVAAGAIIVSVSLIDLQRSRRELGLLASIGWRERDVFILLLIRSVFMGLMGAVVGIALSYVIGGYICGVLVPEKVAMTFNIFPRIPEPAYLPQAPLLSVGLSALAFTVGYIYYRRQTPLTMLQK